MNHEARIAALRAAAKVAFGVAFLTGCSTENADDGTNDPAQEAEVKSAGTKTKKFSCIDLVNAAFPEEGGYPGKAVKTTAEVRQCCSDILVESGGMSAHRWDCCANHEAKDDQKIGTACTPWGPPCPPAMRTRGVA